MDRDGEIIICRCEDITLAEVRRCLRDPGCRGIEDLKRMLRVTMGPCGGRSCRELLLREVARFYATTIDEVAPPVFRPPTTPLPLDAVARSVNKGGDVDA